MSSPLFCSHCGAPLTPGAKSCANCGTPAQHQRQWWPIALSLVVIAALATGITWILLRGTSSETEGSGSGSGTSPASSVSVTTTAPPSSTAAATTTAAPSTTAAAAGCDSAEYISDRPPELGLLRFFRALNGHDYATAFALLSTELQNNWVAVGPSGNALANFTAFYRDHLRCVTVTNIKNIWRDDPTISASLGIQWYEVTFDAEYISPFPAGSGQLQPYYRVHCDPHDETPEPLITGEATG